ncbi:4'-phosphopantetheinyl transferase family protein [Psychrobacter ciconiae]|uniref:4'-phosphopantetheinyl transferase family protein n=1 Tax=Psychrobacter ciconiae TaxID=1553449 RepID=UPI001917F3AF|nr:hypothetical protein [Psychrobacter ciconiae]
MNNSIQNKAMITLEHTKFYQLNEDSWCALATLPKLDSLLAKNDTPEQKKHERQQQRQGTRQLLTDLLCYLNISDELVETSFPYHLKDTGAFICFSHSGSQVAVAISHQRPIGLDIEAQAISWQVAKRYYHLKEITELSKLDDYSKQTISRLLWQIKESIIKIEQFTLAQGLGKDYSALILPIHNAILTGNTVFNLPINLSNTSSYQVCIKLDDRLAVVF